ncbi:MAG: ABC transporter [Ignavibacteriales bacterium CG18_big_fil_WC_8_21_14_2_50_31_20]|nr:MAG: ABC transporter [Ignavibacteriales bacterium CG18_big_fil_WC_8_21_14_2_50_31_20]
MAENVTPVILTAMEISLNFGEQIIFDNASLSIHEGDRIGLVGRNGAGKSTFLKIISNQINPTFGNVAKKKNLNIGFLTQDFTLNNSKSVLENILDGAESIQNLIHEYEKAPYDSPKRELLEKEINEKDAWNLDKQISVLMKALDTPNAESQVGLLSGGEKRRVALCRALISKPDLLILDEPTNHLDTDSIVWIENFLAGYKGTCIFVTHDRYFLDRIANRIVELANGTFFSHKGNYTDYLINKSERQAIEEVEEKKRQNFLKRELEWVRRGPKARTTKSKSRLDKYYEIESKENLEVELQVDLVIPPPERLGNKVVELNNIGMSLGGKQLIEGLTFAFDSKRRLGIVGKNGVGKTTLLKLILGELKPQTGQIEIGEKTEFNYVDQSRLTLNDEDTVIESIGEGNNSIKFGNRDLSIFTYLRRFLFTDDRINTKIGRLSGGERSRLTLASILKNGGNFIILDEPTNDLDLPTLRILEEALLSFDGCVVVVSHDRYFLNRVCNGILAFEDNGDIHFSEGDYNYYIEKKKLRSQKKNTDDEPAIQKAKRAKEITKKLSWSEKKELDEMEKTILEAEAEVEKIEAIFSLPDFFAKYAEQTKELNDNLEIAKQKVHNLYDRWEELESKRSSN